LQKQQNSLSILAQKINRINFSGFEMPQLFHPLRNTANILGFAQIVKEATSGDTRYIFS